MTGSNIVSFDRKTALEVKRALNNGITFMADRTMKIYEKEINLQNYGQLVKQMLQANGYNLGAKWLYDGVMAEVELRLMATGQFKEQK